MSFDLSLTVKRELAILNHLASLPPESSADGLSPREIYDHVKDVISDTITIQAYYKILDSMVLTGRLEEVDSDSGSGGKRYRAAPNLHSANQLTLADIDEQTVPSEFAAKVVAAYDYLNEEREGALKEAATRLLQENPVEVFYEFICSRVERLRHELEQWHHLTSDGKHELQDGEREVRIRRYHEDLHRIVRFGLGLPRKAITLPDCERLESDPKTTIKVDRIALKEALTLRVVGPAFLHMVEAKSPSGKNNVMAGSDGSTHAGLLDIQSAKAYFDETEFIVRFNNAIVYLEDPQNKSLTKHPFHSVPMTRSALDDMKNRGMILIRPMYSGLSDSEFEHMAKCATDVVQWRVDETVFRGKARAIGSEELLPQPMVHLRDGTVVPQERELSHYNRRKGDAYGEFVREGVTLCRDIVQMVTSSQNTPSRPVFAGCVKSTQLQIFASVLNWYICSGSKKNGQDAICPGWDMRRAAFATDNMAMTLLLASITKPENLKAGKFLCSCVLIRPFHALVTHLADAKIDNRDPENYSDWVEYFIQWGERRKKAHEELGEPTGYLDNADVSRDAYVWLCGNADFALFYMGHTIKDPAPILPRYEFIESFREKDAQAITQLSMAAMNKIVSAISFSGFGIDTDHNYLTNKNLFKLLPKIIQHAHEICKAMGLQLEKELRSAIVQQLQQVKGRLLPKGMTATVLPMPVRQFIEQIKKNSSGPKLPKN